MISVSAYYVALPAKFAFDESMIFNVRTIQGAPDLGLTCRSWMMLPRSLFSALYSAICS